MNCPTVYSVEDSCILLNSKLLDNDSNTIAVKILISWQKINFDQINIINQKIHRAIAQNNYF
jgi:hypothetical protein